MDLDILSTKRKVEDFFGEELPLAATIRLTKACNLRCPHCYVDAGCPLKNELTTKELKLIIDQLVRLKVFYVFYTGGEPFLRKDISEILKYTHKKGIGISISSNGTVLNKDILNKVKDIPFTLFQISLDGTKKIHESIRGKGSWDKAIKAIKLARSKLKGNIGLGTVISKKNFYLIDKILSTGASAGADTFTLLCLILSGRADESQNPSPKEFMNSVKLAFKEYKRLRPALTLAKDTTVPPALIPSTFRKKMLHMTFAPCSFPYYLGVNANGDVAPCDGLFNIEEMVVGNIREKPLEEIWRKSKLLKELRKINPSDLKGICGKCIYKDYCCGGCRAHAFIKYRDFAMPDPVCQTVYEAGLFPKDSLR